jgi:hypothetical protein
MTLNPDFKQAQAFLDAIQRDGSFIFQTVGDGDPCKELIRVIRGPLSACADTLTRLNAAGAGIFAMINEGTERRSAGVTAVRAYFVDLDGAPVEPLIKAAMPPDILVESSPGRYHGYWLTARCPLKEFKPRQQCLAAHFDGDPVVCDLPRAMRLPGFFHRKASEPFMSRLIKPSYADEECTRG